MRPVVIKRLISQQRSTFRTVFLFIYGLEMTATSHIRCFLFVFYFMNQCVIRLSRRYTCRTKSFVQCRFTSSETVRTIRDGETRTSTSTLTQLLSSEEFEFNVALRPQRPYGPLGTGAQDFHLHSHTAPDL